MIDDRQHTEGLSESEFMYQVSHLPPCQICKVIQSARRMLEDCPTCIVKRGENWVREMPNFCQNCLFSSDRQGGPLAQVN